METKRSGWPWWWFLAGVVILIVIIQLGSNFIASESSYPPDSASIRWNDDYQAGLEQAKDQDKLLLLDFSAPWCPACQQMKKTTYHDPEVIKVSEKFIPVHIDVDKNSQLADKYKVRYIPTYAIVKPDESLVDSFFGLLFTARIHR